MKKLLFIYITILCIGSVLHSETLIVGKFERACYSSIQTAIDNSSNGDTVLVYPGTYVENIDFNGKNIILASLELITGDESYIDSTVIDGGKQSSCIRLHNSEQNAVIQGFSITNGKGYEHIHHAMGRVGGGIAIDTPYGAAQTYCTIKNCKIFNNKATGGAGIYCKGSKIHLSGIKITENYGSTGGGLLFLNQSNIIFDNNNQCDIYNNYGGIGCDIHCYNTGDINVIVDTFTVFEPFGYFVDYSEEGAYAGEVTFNIQHAWMEEINHDLYVAPDGDDNNTGLSPVEPLKTIAWALHKIESDSVNPKTVYVEEGTYSNELNVQIYPLGLKSYTSLIGNSIENPVIITDSFYTTILGGHIKGDITLKNFTLRSTFDDFFTVISLTDGENFYLSDLIIDNNYSPENSITFMNKNTSIYYNNINFINNSAEKGVGIEHEKGNAFVRDCFFYNNHSFGTINQSYANYILEIYGYNSIVVENSIFINNSNANSGLAPICLSNYQFYSPDIYVKNCLFAGNETPCASFFSSAPGDVQIPDSLDIHITNCTFAGNESSLSTLYLMGAVDITNTILYDSTDYEIYLGDWSYHDIYATVNIKNCNIKNGKNSILNMNENNTVNWLEGNIDEDPLFVGGESIQL